MFSILVDHIEKHFTRVKALNDISFTVDKGELFGFIGPDGAGKTTLFRILTTLLIPDHGKALVNGLDVVKDFRKIRQDIGYMPGKFSLYSDLTVEENLNFYATVFGTTVAENYDLIRDIYSQIEPFKKRMAGKLSGGMKQKLALSCALIHKPSVLILDEPTTGVDAVSRLEFWEMLKRLKNSGISIVVATPYMDEASLCDRVALIQNGKIMAISPPSEVIKTYPRQLFSIKSDDIFSLLNDLRQIPQMHTVFAFGQSAHISFKQEPLTENFLYEYLCKKGHSNIKISHIQATIEDCFMDLMIKPQ
ncbi:MAG: ABC transporter ATP-binding protein [Bacteroidales bacterium]|nr:ABC transporter ATP-binding protein [Bacteroidales bacterium]MDD4602755.1 ABC transporter ATP-binding protein [Bacteroidales bacterium]